MRLTDAEVAVLAGLPESEWWRRYPDGMPSTDERRVRAARKGWLAAAAEGAVARAALVEPVAPAAPIVTTRAQLFPPCADPGCPRAGDGPHACLLPHQVEGFDAPEPFVAMLGGYGAAKTQWAVALGVALTCQVAGNVGFVLRRSYPKLRDSVLRVYLETLDRAGVPYEASDVEKGMPHRLTLPNGSEIRFRESRDIGRLLSTECGWFHLEEAAEEPKATWGALLGRLRLAAARHVLKGILTSNPPSHQHWLAEVFGLRAGVTARVDPVSGQTLRTRLILVGTDQNPHLPPGYVAALRTTHAAHDVRRLVDGHFGFQAAGTPVYPQFDPGQHVVTPLVPLPAVTLVRAWDFGFRAPAVTWHQFPRCAEGRVHWWIVGEYLGRDLEAEELADVVLSETRALRALAPPADTAPAGAVDCGDAAGAQRSDKGPGPIVRLARAPYLLRFRYRHLSSVDPGLADVRLALGEARCACGQMTVAVAPRCRHTIDALAGGYHYKELKPGQAHTDAALKPTKDGFYDNVADTLRYAAEHHYRRLRRDPAFLADLAPRAALPRERPWDWMDGARRVG